jgi:hypothetical protein
MIAMQHKIQEMKKYQNILVSLTSSNRTASSYEALERSATSLFLSYTNARVLPFPTFTFSP